MNSREPIPLEGGELWLQRVFIAPDNADSLLQVLLEEIPWRQDDILLFGRQQKIPRLQAFMADPGISYSYSGKALLPSQWHKIVSDLRQQLLQQTGYDFNAVLLNLYRDGRDSMGWHSDDETELGDLPVIASLSLGAERQLLFRRRQRHKGEKSLGLTLPSGSLLWMAGELQRNWQHSLPRTSACHAPRINLTFRQIR